MNQSGQCLCGAVKFVANEVTPHYHACHCGMCRRWSGGPGFAAAATSLAFESEELVQRFASSDWGERGFCSRCGSNLFFHVKPTGQYLVMVGAMDDVQAFTLDGEIYIDEKPAGYAFAGDHPRQTGQEFLESIGAGTD